MTETPPATPAPAAPSPAPGPAPGNTQKRVGMAGILGAAAGYAIGAPFALQPLALYPAPLEVLRNVGAPGWIPLAVAAGVGLVLLIPRRTRVWSLSLMVAAAAFFAVAVPLERIRANRHENAVRAFDQQTVPLISAVHKFVNEQGAPPKRLDDLVPRYLRSLPRPSGLGARRIQLHAEDRAQLSRHRMTYALGRTSGDLGIDLNADYRVLRMKVWGVHDPVIQAPFDSAAWYRDVNTRAAMVDAVMAKFPPGTPFMKIARNLGTPENEVVLDYPEWWLELTPNFMVYTPAELRPENLPGVLMSRKGPWRTVILDGAEGTPLPDGGEHAHDHDHE